MLRSLRSHKYAKGLFLLAAFILAGLLIPSAWRVGAQPSLFAPVILPGDDASAAAAGRQEQPQIAQGANNYLAVWSDARTSLVNSEAATVVTSFSGPNDGSGLGTLADIYAARLDANGQVIDTTPIVIKEDVTYGPRNIIVDTAGNWVVVWEDSLPQEGTSLPVGVFIARVSDNGTNLDPGGKVVYNHHSQFMGNPDISRAGDRYLVTFMTFGPPYNTYGLTLDSNFNQLRNGPELLIPNGGGGRVSSNGNIWLVVSGNLATLVSHDGDPFGPAITMRPNSITYYPGDDEICWDGSNWYVAYTIGRFDNATQTSDLGDIYVARVTSDGTVLDPSGISVKVAPGSQDQPGITPGTGGGAQVVWHDNNPAEDVHMATVAPTGTVGGASESPAARQPQQQQNIRRAGEETGESINVNAASADTIVALGAPRQSKQRMIAGSNGFLTVFRDETSGVSRIMGQHLDASGTPVDQEPFVIADGTSNNNPNVAWNGSQYLVVWDAYAPTGVQSFGRLVPPAGLPGSTSFFIMNGYTPDASGLNGNFLVVNILPGHEVAYVQSIILDGAGTVTGTPQTISTGVNVLPRVAAYGARWFVVWEFHANHDDSPGQIKGAFVGPDGTPTAPFFVSGSGNDSAPHLAIAGNTALVIWSNGDIYGRRINPDGSSPDGADMPIAVAPEPQLRPAISWDGNQYIVDWIDHRNDPYPFHPRGDIYGARVAITGVPLEEFPVANSPLPEETPYVVSTAANNLTIFSYAKFYDTAPYAAHRITLRKANFAAPDLGTIPNAPGNLIATQDNEGVGGVTLNWTDNSLDEVGFKVESSSDGTTWHQIKLLPANSTTVSGLFASANTPTYFRVRAYNAAGDSAYSNVASPPVINITLTGSGIFIEPANVTIKADVSDTDPIVRVEFYIKRDGEPLYVLLGTDTDAPYGFDWTNIPRGTYDIRAKAIDANGSSTLSNEMSILVKGIPVALITSPAGGAVFTQPADITLTATAQVTNNRSDEYVQRLDFYDGTRWIGQGQAQVWQGPWSFIWTGAPAGMHNITAQATSNLGDTGISPPVVVTVVPKDPPDPDLNIKPVVLLTAPANNSHFAANTPVPARATATDADGTIARVEFRANGQLIEADTTAPYSAQLNLPGGTHSITAVAVDNRDGATTSSSVNITIDRTPGTQLANNPSDGSSFGPSIVTQAGPPVDQEFADDFDITGDIDRIVFGGTRGFNAPSGPIIRGAFVRFYAWNNGNPGALQDEIYLPAGSPGLVFDANEANTFDVTLPHSFRATGKHFVSFQLFVQGYQSYWYWGSSHTGSPQNSAIRTRDNYAGATWGPVVDIVGPKNCDALMSIYGTFTTPGSITSVTPQTIARSGWFNIKGTNFGTSQGGVQIDGIGAIVVKWTSTEIFGYVPEGAHLGSVPLVVTTSAGTSKPFNINVTGRQANGRLRWQTKYLGDYLSYRPAVAPAGSPEAGSVYALVSGLIYAWSPTGALKWIVKGGGVGQITVGLDGTIYVGDAVLLNNTYPTHAALTALNRDGSVKWQVIDAQSNNIYAGPNVGPDGKVYIAFSPGQYNTAAFNPDGSLAWSRNDSLPAFSNNGISEIVFGHSLSRVYYTSNALYARDLAGNFVFKTSSPCCVAPAVAPDDNLRAYTSNYSGLNGSQLYQFPFFGQGPSYPAAAGPDNTHYIVQNYYRLYAINPNGTEKWHYDNKDFDNSLVFANDPNVSPSNSMVVMGGRGSGKSGYYVGVDPATGQMMWRQLLPDEPGFAEYGQIEPFNKLAFTSDGATAYGAGDVLGDGDSRYQGTRYGFFYAINTTTGNVAINQPPTALLTNPLPNSNLARNTQVNVTASVQDDGAIDRVEFYYNHNGSTTLFGTDTTPDENGLYSAPFSASDPGVYGLYAVAYDTGGLRGDSPIAAVSVNNEPPHVNWVSPLNGASFTPAPPSITLTAHATDLDGTITQVQFSSSMSGILGTDTTADANGNYTVEWANPPSGTHQLSAQATDNTGYAINSVITVNINPASTPTPTPTPTPSPSPTPVGNPPTITITSPADSSSFAPGTSVTVTASASDSDGTIARVDFYRDSLDFPLGTDFNAPYSMTVNSGTADVWSVFAVATDNSGNETTSGHVRIIWEDPNGTLKISGRIRHQQSAPGHEVFLRNSRVSLYLHGSLFKTTLTDSLGNYLFNNLSRGGEYTVQPSEPGYEYFPPAVTFNGLTRNETWDFTAAGPLPDPTPTPTPGASDTAWERIFDGPQHQADTDPHIAVDEQGNTYVTATSGAANGGDTDISTIKYDAMGQQLWAVTYAGPGNYKDWANDIKVDSQGNSYITGVAWGGSNSEYDAVTIKYDTNGNQVWAKLYNAPVGHWDRGEALDLIRDGGGNVLGVVITGYSQTTTAGGASFDEALTIRYDADGNEKWVRRHTTAQVSDHAMGIVIDSGGNIYITGFALTSPTTTSTTKNFLTIKYSPDGQELWASLFLEGSVHTGPFPLPNNPTFDEAGHIALDSNGSIYVAGTNQPGLTGPDFLLLKYNPATGVLVWNRNWAGPSSDFLRDMAIDSGGNIFLTGESYDGDYQSATGNETADVATIKFSGAGSIVWERIYRGFPGKWDGGRAVAVDPVGNAYVGAYSTGFVNTDTAVIKYEPDGNEAWVFRYDNPQHTDDSLHDMAMDPIGNIYLAGQAIQTNASGDDTTDLITVKLAPATEPLNSPPDITVSAFGPTIAGGPGHPVGDPTGPTIAGRTLMLSAAASDRDGTVTRVDFYDGETLIGSDTTSPYSFEWNNVPLGAHAIIAAATDNSGATRASQTFSVVVVDGAQTHTISGVVATSNGGTPLANVPVFLNNMQTHDVVTVMTDANGFYTFEGLAHGGKFMVTPFGAYTYQPANARVEDLQDNQTFDFIGTSIDPPDCAYSLSVTSRNFTSSGGNSTFNLNAEKGCPWKARSNNPWLLLTGQTDGNGQTPIAYRVLENTATTSRTGTITVAGQTFTVTQDAASAVCTVHLSQAGETISFLGGEYSVSVSAGSGCSWSAVSSDSWITIDSGGTGLGAGVVSYSVSRNNGALRTGTINIGGQMFTIEQKAGNTGQ
jgi:hypothetical protein